MNYLTLLPACLRQYFYSNYLTVAKELNDFWLLLPALSNCKYTNKDDMIHGYEQFRTTSYFITHGYLKVVQWLHYKRIWPLYPNAMISIAALNGQLPIVNWFREIGTKPSIITMLAAVKGGHLHILQYLLDQGCPIHEDTLETAVMHGHLHILQWINQATPVKEVAGTFILPSSYNNIKFSSSDKHDPHGLVFYPAINGLALDYNHDNIVIWLVECGYYPISDAMAGAVQYNRLALLAHFSL